MRKKRKRRSRIQKRQLHAIRGKRLVLGAVAVSVLFYAAVLFVAVGGFRWGSGFSPDHVVASFTAGTAFVLGSFFAVYAYLGHPIFRQLYVVLNFVAAVAGISWVGYHWARGGATEWLLFDIAGIGTVLFICWVFSCAQSGRAFFQEQEFTVERK